MPPVPTGNGGTGHGPTGPQDARAEQRDIEEHLTVDAIARAFNATEINDPPPTTAVLNLTRAAA